MSERVSASGAEKGADVTEAALSYAEIVAPIANRVFCGNCEDMRAIPDGVVHCVVTSPPYHGLRDYGTGEWVDGTDLFAQATSTFRATSGWRQNCACTGDRSAPVPALVLDPFMGSGTVASVALKLGRRFVGYELNLEYIPLIENRAAVAERRAYEAAMNGGDLHRDNVGDQIDLGPLFPRETVA